MPRVLLPVDESSDSRRAVQHVVRQHAVNAGLEIHVLNVQPRLRRNIAQFVGKQDWEAFCRERAQGALRPIRRLLDDARTPYTVHVEIGSIAPVIVMTASRLGCDCIVIGRARKNALTRFIEQSVSNEVLEMATVPVIVIAARAASKVERFGVPAGVGAALALLLLAAAD